MHEHVLVLIKYKIQLVLLHHHACKMFSVEGSEVIIALVWSKKQNFSVRPSCMTIYF